MPKRIFFLALLAVAACVPVSSCAQQVSQGNVSQEKEQVLWQKLEATIGGVDRNLDGVLGVAILDLTTGQKYLLHADASPARSLRGSRGLLCAMWPR